MSSATKQSGRPAGAIAPAPYWEFDWQLIADGGLKLANLVAVGTDPAAPTASVPVAELVDFTDLKIAFNDTTANTFVEFPVAAAFAHKDSRFAFGTNGTNGNLDVPDPLYQYGMMLTLVHDFGGTCKVKLSLSIAFRGATNDFDPGGVPVHMNIYPQIGWTWESTGSSKRRVRRFRGSVRVTVNNQTPASPRVPPLGSMPEIMAMPAVAENIANCFTDSNVSKEPGNTRCAIMVRGKTADLEFFVPDRSLINDEKPFGWGMVFDYMLMNIQDELEYTAVYGPADTGFYGTPWRTGLYKWPAAAGSFKPDYKVAKAPRQGCYDNIHLHGRMGMVDINGNEQIHAPFCGHSCVHMHWRWSGVAAGTAPVERRWYYKGWSTGKTIEGNTTDHSPLIPPNQKLTVAICRPGHVRVNDTQILPSTGRGKLDKLRKLIWYCADVIHTDDVPINATEQQVILEAGLGWAYRYALPADECPALYSFFGLLTAFKGEPDKPYTQERIMEFFEKKVYPGFRYYDDGTIKCDQIPQGTYDQEMTGPGKPMEKL